MRPGVDLPGVGCGLVIRRADGKVLLCRRMKAPEAGSWSIPGGKVDAMEPSAQAARRETLEETGLDVGPVELLGVTEEILPADGQHWISLIYLARAFQGEPRLMEPDKLSALDWFDPADPPRPLSVFAEKAFAMLAR